MERTPEGTADTVLATRDTAPAEDSSTAPTLIAGTAERVGGGAQPSDRYRLGDMLGRGGMGEVMSARDQQIGRSVAIKRLRGEASETAIARFWREAKIQGGLDHPSIVPVHELCRDEQGRPYFVMKQLAGTTLADVLGSRDPEVAKKFPLQRLLRAFVDVCLAIEFAHTRNVIHRDLKPANIMLGDFGEVYVLDWGIARLIGEADRPSLADLPPPAETATVAGAVLGTPGYMPPEQIRGETDLDGRVDVFALGCILFEILAGSSLYPRGADGMTQALLGADAKPSHRAPERGIAPELDQLCIDATQTERADRLASARALGDRVQKFLDGDRDLAMRRTLAARELETARAALDRGTLADRRIAFQAATRALALDPHATEPGQLVGKLMLETPRETPPEVERELDEGQRAIIVSMAKASTIACFGYATVFPLSYLCGIDDPAFFIPGIGLLVLIIAMAVFGTRSNNPIAYFRINFFFNCALVGVFAQATSPFFLAPAMIVLILNMFASQPRVMHPLLVITGGLVALFVPLALQLLELTQRRFGFTPTAMLFDPAGATLDGVWVIVGMVTFCVGVVLSAALLARNQAIDRDELQRKVQLHAWQMRQLVPQSETA